MRSRRGSGWPFWLAAAAVTLLVALLAALGASSRLPVTTGRPQPTSAATIVDAPGSDAGDPLETANTVPLPSDRPTRSAPWWPTVVVVFGILVAATAIGIIVSTVLTNPPRPRWDVLLGRMERGRVEAHVAEALRRIAGGERAAGVVADCWRALEGEGARLGVVRQPSETAADYAIRLAAKTSATPSDLAELAELYRKAVFSADGTDWAETEAAIACLQRLRAELAVSP